jgi:hypothetical protein
MREEKGRKNDIPSGTVRRRVRRILFGIIMRYLRINNAGSLSVCK